jgi:uncharacterized surface protein with fasciclin (FAS1) repeats
MRVARKRWLITLSVVLVALATACSGGFNGSIPYTGQPQPTNVPQTMVDVLKNDPQQRFTELLQLVQTANLNDVLTAPGPLTLFAPTNDAINRSLTAAEIQTLSQDVKGLESFVKGHVADKDVTFTQPSYVVPVTNNGTTQLEVDGKVALNDAGLIIVKSDTPLVMENSTRVVVSPNKTISQTTGSNTTVKITQPDIQAPNGFIQVIDGVLGR